jgi:cadmium resistance transport/sequestration family protein
MDWFAPTVTTGITAFVATNIDDIVILMLLFSQINATFRPKHIIAGQYLGFAALMVASLPGFFGGFLVPKLWLGLLGLVPIGMGIHQLIDQEPDATQVQTVPHDLEQPIVAHWLAPQTAQVAAITIANGGDNIGIYLPLFANSNLVSLGVLLAVFAVLIGVWCYVAAQLTRHSIIASWLTHYGNRLVPFVLIGLGVFILVESGTYRLVPSL